jgi:excisionase family DNA binding protein
LTAFRVRVVNGLRRLALPAYCARRHQHGNLTSDRFTVSSRRIPDPQTSRLIFKELAAMIEIYRIRYIMSSLKFRLRYIFFLRYKSAMKLLNTSQAAEALGVSERRVRALIAEGKLEAQKVGRDYAIEESDLKSVKTYGKSGRPPKPDQKKKQTTK